MYFAAESCNHADNCLEHGLSSEAACFSASQTIPRFLCTPKVRPHVHSSPPLVAVLSQMKPVYSLSSYCCNIILPSVSRSSKWFFPFCPLNLVCICLPTCPAHCMFLGLKNPIVLHLKCRFLNTLTSSTSGPQHPEPVRSAGNTTEMPASLFPDLRTVFVKVRGTGRTPTTCMIHRQTAVCVLSVVPLRSGEECNKWRGKCIAGCNCKSQQLVKIVIFFVWRLWLDTSCRRDAKL